MRLAYRLLCQRRWPQTRQWKPRLLARESGAWLCLLTHLARKSGWGSQAGPYRTIPLVHRQSKMVPRGNAYPLTLWINWCGPRGSEPDPQGQSGDPEGPAVKAWRILTPKDADCAYRPTRPGDPFCWSRGSLPGPQGPARAPESGKMIKMVKFLAG